MLFRGPQVGNSGGDLGEGGVLNSIPRGIGSEKMAGISGNDRS